MARKLACWVGSTDVIAGGQFDLTQAELSGAGEGGALAAAKLRLTARGGGSLVVPIRTPVQLYEYETAGGHITFVWFDGFVVQIETSVEGEEKVWIVTCVGVDTQLDALLRYAPAVSTTANAPFKTQIQQVVTAAQTGGSYTPTAIDADTLVPDWYSATHPPFIGLPAKSYVNQTLRAMVADVLLTLNTALTTASLPLIQPRATLVPNPNATTTLGPAALLIYDGAAVPTPSLHFSTRNSDIAGGAKPILGVKGRKLDGAQFVTRGIGFGAEGIIGVFQDAAAIAAAPNPYDSRHAWGAPPLNDSRWTDVATATTGVQQFVDPRKYARESYTFYTWERLNLGAFIAITDDWEGLLNYVLPVVEIKVQWITPDKPLMQVTCGSRRLRLGDLPTAAALPPASGQYNAPDPPTNVQAPAPGTVYNPQTQRDEVELTWTPPDTPNLNGFYVRSHTRLNGGVWSSWTTSQFIPRGTNFYTIPGLPVSAFGAAYEVEAQVQAITTAGRPSIFSTPATLVSLPVAVLPDPPTGVDEVETGTYLAGTKRLAYAIFAWTNPVPNLATTWAPETFTTGRPHRFWAEIPSDQTQIVISDLIPGPGTYCWLRGHRAADYGSYATVGPFVAGGPNPAPSLPGMEERHPDWLDPAGILGWAYDPAADTGAPAPTPDAVTGTVQGSTALRLTIGAKNAARVYTPESATSVIAGATYAWRLTRQAQGTLTGVTAPAVIRSYDNTGTFIQDDTLTLTALSGVWVASSGQWTAPAGAVTMRPRLGAAVSGVPTGTPAVLWASPQPEDWQRAAATNDVGDSAITTAKLGALSVTSAKIAAGAVGNAQMGTITDVAKFQGRTGSSAQPRGLYDSTGTQRGSEYYSDAADSLNYGADNTTGNTYVRFFEPGTAEVQLRSGRVLLLGGRGLSVRTVTTSQTLVATDYLVLIDASGGAITLTLPAVSSAPGGVALEFRFKRIDATANVVKIVCAGADTIEGATLISLVGQYTGLNLVSDAASVWYQS